MVCCIVLVLRCVQYFWEDIKNLLSAPRALTCICRERQSLTKLSEMNERERARICFFLRNTGKKFTDIINSTKHQGQGEKSTEKNEQCYVPHQKKNEQYACVTVEFDRGFGGSPRRGWWSRRRRRTDRKSVV